MQRGQFRRGVRAELLGQDLARVPVGREGLGGPSGRDERPHQGRDEPFPQGVFGDEGGELAGQLAAEAPAQVRLDPVLQDRHPQFREAGHRRPEEIGGGDVQQRRPAPQFQCLAQDPGGGVRVQGQHTAAGGGQPFEADHVHGIGFDRQPVPGRMRFHVHAGGAQGPPQP